MKSLVVDDDFSHRLLLQRFLVDLGEVHIAVNGSEAIEAVRAALAEGQPYDVICLDILMPGVDGHEALAEIRRLEAAAHVAHPRPAKVAMTSALDGKEHVLGAFREQADAYLVKPVRKERLLETVRGWGLLGPQLQTGT
ncbi:MAG: response regulator [Myxococcaceae bacterium]